jgi:hypothetical protein
MTISVQMHYLSLQLSGIQPTAKIMTDAITPFQDTYCNSFLCFLALSFSPSSLCPIMLFTCQVTNKIINWLHKVNIDLIWTSKPGLNVLTFLRLQFKNVRNKLAFVSGEPRLMFAQVTHHFRLLASPTSMMQGWKGLTGINTSLLQTFASFRQRV